ncbi:MAG: hypothetical protein NT027_15130 [Proteobacteria bacterium]|nr:hypothetical protein [Pseudomonadota bacterium]
MTPKNKANLGASAFLITYSNMTVDECQFFWNSGLKDYFDIGLKLLEKRLGKPNSNGFDGPLFSASQLNDLHLYIEDILTLIESDRVSCLIKASNQAKVSTGNLRNSKRPVDQIHKSFLNPQNAASFRSNLYLARRNHKKDFLMKRKSVNLEQFNAKLQYKDIRLFSNKVFRNIPGEKKVRYGANKFNESETRGIAVLYMIELIWMNIKPFVKGGIASGDQLSTFMSLALQLPSLLDESNRFLENSMSGKLKRKQGKDPIKQFISSELKNNSRVNTSVLAKRVLSLFDESSSDLEDTPSQRSIEDLIRKVRKNLRGTGSCKK